MRRDSSVFKPLPFGFFFIHLLDVRFFEVLYYGIRMAVLLGIFIITLRIRDPLCLGTRNIHYYDSTIMSHEEARKYSSICHDRAHTELFIRIFRESLDPRQMRELEKRLSVMKNDKQPLVQTRLFWAK